MSPSPSLPLPPGLVRTVAARWDLDVGDPFLPGGCTAWVAPARSADHGDVVLKVARRHPERRLATAFCL